MDSDKIVVASPHLKALFPSTHNKPINTLGTKINNLAIPESNLRTTSTGSVANSKGPNDENRRPLPVTPGSREPRPKKQRLSASTNAFIQPITDKDDLQNDLEKFGFTEEKIRGMLTRKEANWDPATPGHHVVAERTDDVERREKRARARKNGTSGGRAAYEPLFLTEGSSWVLFDPAKGFPLAFGDAPAVMERFATFNSGNERVVEFNIVSGSVRIRCTPQLLRDGRSVEYAKTGPKIIDPPTAPKRARGRPRKSSSSGDGVGSVVVKEKSPEKNNVKSTRTRGRPRKPPIKVSDSNGSDSDSSLTDLELVDDDGDWIGDEVEVKIKKELVEVEIGDSETKSPLS